MCVPADKALQIYALHMMNRTAESLRQSRWFKSSKGKGISSERKMCQFTFEMVPFMREFPGSVFIHVFFRLVHEMNTIQLPLFPFPLAGLHLHKAKRAAEGDVPGSQSV